mmetsp:Transcript_27392/g.24270  ORF Transcript_27392/g.24270 Transcript_27392/m.24270 type:complete len:178 (+) Transcript_27392:56-589(+)
MYGIPVSFTFKGNDKFNTSIGGVSTLGVLGLVLWYTITQIKLIIGRENTSINSNEIWRSLLKETNTFDIGNDGFIIGTGGIHKNGEASNILYDNSFLSVRYRQYTSKYDKIGGNLLTDSFGTLGTKFCGTDFSKLLSQEVIEGLGLSYFFCPNTTNWSIGGTETGLQFKYLEATVKR